jgi:hypothetical protein
MEKQFNTAGPVNQPDMYKIDPLKRWKLKEIIDLIEQRRYFILHAPRQTGKTSCLLALRDYLNKEGKYFAVYANFEAAQGWRNDVYRALKAITSEIRIRLSELGVDKKILSGLQITENDVESGLYATFSQICTQTDKPIVFFIDEIDALIGDTLVSVLRQLRSGYDKRPANFPSTIILCGVRDIKDYRIQTSGQEIITGGSAFNIKTKSLRLENFTKEEVIDLYTQHTTETGQKFEKDCFDLIMEYTDGQPWLVNALAREVTYKMTENRDRSITITTSMLEEAKERLILERQTHIDHLADKLKEDRVRRIILPMLLGELSEKVHEDDKDYCIDLGLIKKINGEIQIANLIYKEVIPRALTNTSQFEYFNGMEPDWINPDGSLNVNNLFVQFKEFWNENAEIVQSDIEGYNEAVPHLIIQAFLQRVINGGGTINREYGAGRKRVDIMVKWKYPLSGKWQVVSGKISEQLTVDSGQWQYQNIVMEIKTINKKQKYESLREKALKQTAEYAKICGEKQAYILIFDRDNSQKWKKDEPVENAEYDDIQIEIWKLTQETQEKNTKRRKSGKAI